MGNDGNALIPHQRQRECGKVPGPAKIARPDKWRVVPALLQLLVPMFCFEAGSSSSIVVLVTPVHRHEPPLVMKPASGIHRRVDAVFAAKVATPNAAQTPAKTKETRQ